MACWSSLVIHYLNAFYHFLYSPSKRGGWTIISLCSTASHPLCMPYQWQKCSKSIFTKKSLNIFFKTYVCLRIGENAEAVLGDCHEFVSFVVNLPFDLCKSGTLLINIRPIYKLILSPWCEKMAPTIILTSTYMYVLHDDKIPRHFFLILRKLCPSSSNFEV